MCEGSWHPRLHPAFNNINNIILSMMSMMSIMSIMSITRGSQTKGAVRDGG